MEQLDNLTPKQRLIKLCEHDEGQRYTFYVPAGRGKDITNAMRMCMTRIRKKAVKYGQILPPFKIFQDPIVTVNNCDKVTMYRGQSKGISKAEAEYQVRLIAAKLNENGS